MSNVVNLIIRATDQASAIVRSVGAAIRQAFSGVKSGSMATLGMGLLGLSAAFTAVSGVVGQVTAALGSFFARLAQGAQEAAKIERATLRLSRAIGSLGAARREVAELLDSPLGVEFDDADVVRANLALRQLTGNMRGGAADMRLMGDVAANTDQDISSVAHSVGVLAARIAAGQKEISRFTMALVASRIITAQDAVELSRMAEAGVAADKILNRLFDTLNRKHGGALAQASADVGQLGRQLNDTIDDAWRALGRDIWEPLKLIGESAIVTFLGPVQAVLSTIVNTIRFVADFLGAKSRGLSVRQAADYAIEANLYFGGAGNAPPPKVKPPSIADVPDAEETASGGGSSGGGTAGRDTKSGTQSETELYAQRAAAYERLLQAQAATEDEKFRLQEDAARIAVQALHERLEGQRRAGAQESAILATETALYAAKADLAEIEARRAAAAKEAAEKIRREREEHGNLQYEKQKAAAERAQADRDAADRAEYNLKWSRATSEQRKAQLEREIAALSNPNISSTVIAGERLENKDQIRAAIAERRQRLAEENERAKNDRLAADRAEQNLRWSRATPAQRKAQLEREIAALSDPKALSAVIEGKRLENKDQIRAAIAERRQRLDEVNKEIAAKTSRQSASTTDLLSAMSDAGAARKSEFWLAGIAPLMKGDIRTLARPGSRAAVTTAPATRNPVEDNTKRTADSLERIEKALQPPRR